MLPTLDAPRRHLMLELLLGALTAFAPLSIDMYLPALPAIGQDLQAPAPAVGLTLVSVFPHDEGTERKCRFPRAIPSPMRRRRPLDDPARCRRCRMRTELCLCGDLAPFPTRTRVLVLLHRIERYKTTNTGRIATLALADSELREWDLLDAPNGAEGLSDPGACLLYPSPNARELEPADPPSLLVVPDATWHVTRSMVRKSPELSAMPRVRLPEGGPSVFRLRENRHPGAVCTLEAVARALGILEGPEVEAHLMAALEEMTRRVESTRPPMMLERSAALRARSDPADPAPG